MGCVFGREASGRRVVERREDTDVAPAAAAVAPTAAATGPVVRVEKEEARNGGDRKEEEEGSVRSRRRSGRPNPRLSNPPKNVHGEQVAAGWPSWLSAAAGEAINGWTPRRADTFEKLDKVRIYYFPIWNHFGINGLCLFGDKTSERKTNI